MANIEQELLAFKNAKKGEDVRDSMISAIRKINTVNEEGVEEIETKSEQMVEIIDSQIQIDEDPTEYTKLKLETTGTDIEVLTADELENEVASTEIIKDLMDSVYSSESFDWHNLATGSYTTGWRTGYYNATTGVIASSNAYMRVASLIKFDDSVVKVRAVAPTGYAIAIYEYDANDSYIGKYGLQDSTDAYATSEVTVNVTRNYIYRIAVGKFANNSAPSNLNDSFTSTIVLEMFTTKYEEIEASITEVRASVSDIESEIEGYQQSAWNGSIGTALTYRLPYEVPNGIKYIEDITETDGADANITQGICSDGERYLFYNLAPMGSDFGRNVLQRIRKWDTWANKSVGLSEAGDWGHCEDICYVPFWVKGFDNGNVNRLYVTDFNYSTGHPEGYYIHVINADTLEYITSFRTDTLINSEYWSGAMHITFNQERGLFALKCATTIEEVKYWCIAVFDQNGLLQRACKVRYVGTGIGFDSDENYIYPVRYVTLNGVTTVYGYVVDWDLTPVARYTIEKFDWEIEGCCHIGRDLYYSYNQSAGSGRKNTIEKTKAIFKYYGSDDIPPFDWTNSDGVHVGEWVILEV